MIWFTSDTHFNHANIIKYCARPFDNVEQMNAALVDKWNEVVDGGDTVYHLGDFAFLKDHDEIAFMLSMLNGTKHLIAGNHDGGKTRKQQGWRSMTVGARHVEEFVLSHHPILIAPHEKLLHGHKHSSMAERRTARNSLDVGVDAWNYRPVSLDEVRIVLCG